VLVFFILCRATKLLFPPNLGVLGQTPKFIPEKFFGHF
jgi:hypothetical protein